MARTGEENIVPGARDAKAAERENTVIPGVAMCYMAATRNPAGKTPGLRIECEVTEERQPAPFDPRPSSFKPAFTTECTEKGTRSWRRPDSVIPAQAGMRRQAPWIPDKRFAFSGMTLEGDRRIIVP